MKSPNAVKITLTKSTVVGSDSYRVTRICRAIRTNVSIPHRSVITVGDSLNTREADLLCEQRNYEVTIQ